MFFNTRFVATFLLFSFVVVVAVAETTQELKQNSSALSTAATDKQSTKLAAPTEKEDKPSSVLVLDLKGKSFQRLHPENEIWVNMKEHFVVLGGKVSLRRGPLEMFACTKGTKEHESVVSVNCKAFNVHTALIAIGAKSGTVAKFHPTYSPASGVEIEVFVQWKDEKGVVQQQRAQKWVRNVLTKKEMDNRWVFAGSGFWQDEETGTNYYQAESGDLICVSNFPTATLDLPVESSATNEGLVFESFTERIPPRETKVWVILKPVPKKPANKETTTKEKSGS